MGFYERMNPSIFSKMMRYARAAQLAQDSVYLTPQWWNLFFNQIPPHCRFTKDCLSRPNFYFRGVPFIYGPRD